MAFRKKFLNRSGRVVLMLVGALLAQPALALVDMASAPTAPEFTHHGDAEWINSKALNLVALRGQVVLLDFWTFDCWNCYRSFPWLRSTEAKFKVAALRVIGVHSPEFEHEKVRDNIVAKIAEFELDHPVMIDTDFSYWNALGNHYWPSFYLIDKHGRIRGTYTGETHVEDRKSVV